MARYVFRISPEKGNINDVKKKLTNAFGENNFTVEKEVIPSSRADRLSEAMDQVSEAMNEVESLKDELQNWLDNLPENLQSGTKADEIQEAIDALEQLYNQLDDAKGEADNVSFPGMY